MVYGLSLEDARLERLGDGRNVNTPWEPGWRREVYEQVIPPFWGYLRKRKHIKRPDGSLDGTAVMDRLVEAADGYTHRHISVEVQEQFLDAMGFRFEDPPAPIEEGCRCPWCMYLDQRAMLLGIVPRDERVHEQFLEALVAHLELVLKAPNKYDRRHGTPPASWRHHGEHRSDTHEPPQS